MRKQARCQPPELSSACSTRLLLRRLQRLDAVGGITQRQYLVCQGSRVKPVVLRSSSVEGWIISATQIRPRIVFVPDQVD